MKYASVDGSVQSWLKMAQSGCAALEVQSRIMYGRPHTDDFADIVNSNKL